MIRYFTAFLICFFIILPSNDIEAKDKVSGKEIVNEGFDNASEIYDRMSPEQKEDVYNKAMSMMDELKEMSPEEIQELKRQLIDIQNSIDLDSINVEDIDTKQELDLQKVQSEIKKYNKQK
ncbi:MAG: hypothetical protein PQ612_06575 [Rickettsiales bacterium]|nr:hypothetical protein [Pseudomonadota bacterium]MDA0966638.1 hypothetical protein [Pseudomonadota bacterium]MDG4543666.1 hypothetical protein [Rickettsiales bacterium]MDG4545813.1 hypothetical protein [Rickettsiales bacterium]MDG4547413.1 hypothetical protein [Rickettsiales bacterium]